MSKLRCFHSTLILVCYGRQEKEQVKPMLSANFTVSLKYAGNTHDPDTRIHGVCRISNLQQSLLTTDIPTL